MRGEELLTVAAGQQIGEYRVDQVADASISFTYLPTEDEADPGSPMKKIATRFSARWRCSAAPARKPSSTARR